MYVSFGMMFTAMCMAIIGVGGGMYGLLCRAKSRREVRLHDFSTDVELRDQRMKEMRKVVDEALDERLGQVKSPCKDSTHYQRPLVKHCYTYKNRCGCMH